VLYFYQKNQHKPNFSDKMMDFFQSYLSAFITKSHKNKILVSRYNSGILLLVLFVFSRMGGEFIPTLAEGDFAFHCILPQGSSLSQSIETSMQASRIIKKFDEVKMVVGKTGAAEVPTDPMPPEATDMMISSNLKRNGKLKNHMTS
jgi:cobalt-zinc-cadmium resistance protein CzcA